MLFGSAVLITCAGLVTMNSFSVFGVSQNRFFDRQLTWMIVSICVFFGASVFDWRFLKNTRIVVGLFGVSVGVLSLLFI